MTLRGEAPVLSCPAGPIGSRGFILCAGLSPQGTSPAIEVILADRAAGRPVMRRTVIAFICVLKATVIRSAKGFDETGLRKRIKVVF